MKKGILSGIRVLDFTWILAGPYATRILADFGAEVIKVQSKKMARGGESNLTGYFNNWNRNKRSITLDLNYPEAREIALKLTAISDVAMENFSPRVMSNWGLTYKNLKKAKADLILVRMSGMGQTGPWKNFVAFAPAIQALSGSTYLTSYDAASPMGLGFSYADTVSGLYAAYAVLAALEARDRTGRGQSLDISEYEVNCSFLGPALMNALINPEEILPNGNSPCHIPAAPYGCYQCAGTDRWCVLAVFHKEEWRALCKVMGDPGWAREKRFSSLSQRKKHAQELDALLGCWTVQQTAEEAVKLLQEAGVPAGVVQNAHDLFEDPQLRARNFFVPMEHPALGHTVSDASPLKLDGRPSTEWKSAPLLGEDNRYVYMDLLGLSKKEFASLKRKGVVG